MAEVLRGWVMGIAGAALITAISMSVSPEGRVKKAVALTCGLVMIIAMIKPVIGLDYTAFSKNWERIRGEAAGFSDEFSKSNEKLTALIIEEECAAYILDKSKGIGIDDLAVTVSAGWSEDGYWYPQSVRLRCGAHIGDYDRSRLSQIITAELGIAPEEIEWSITYEEQ